MTDLSLAAAQTIVAATLGYSAEAGFKPLAVYVLDARGAVRAVAMEDGCSLKRGEIAHAKAYGAVALGMGSRALFTRAQEQPYFIAAVGPVVGGALVPVPGGVLIRDAAGVLIGAVGVSGDTSDNDEAAAVAGILASGLVADAG